MTDGDAAKSKKQRRLAAKALRKAEALDPGRRGPRVPVEEQSIDLPANEEGSLDGALGAVESRELITRRLREKRRKGIKEANFLRGMR